MQGFEAAFNNDVMTTSINYLYSGTLQIMGLTSVLGVPLETVYPEQGHKRFPIYQHVSSQKGTWQRHGSNNVEQHEWMAWQEKEFVVNHFVPIFQQHHPTCCLWTANLKLKWTENGPKWNQETYSQRQKKWKCNGAKQSSTKLFQGKVVERKVQDEVIKSEKKKK